MARVHTNISEVSQHCLQHLISNQSGKGILYFRRHVSTQRRAPEPSRRDPDYDPYEFRVCYLINRYFQSFHNPLAYRIAGRRE